MVYKSVKKVCRFDKIVPKKHQFNKKINHLATVSCVLTSSVITDANIGGKTYKITLGTARLPVAGSAVSCPAWSAIVSSL